MPGFMLDTDTVSFFFRGEGGVADRVREQGSSELCISAVTLAELRYGADRMRSKKLHALIDSFTAAVAVAPFDQAAADRYGEVEAGLSRQGTPIGAVDAMIAAHALVLGVTLVTNNARHFGKVHGLKTENWL